MLNVGVAFLPGGPWSATWQWPPGNTLTLVNQTLKARQWVIGGSFTSRGMQKEIYRQKSQESPMLVRVVIQKEKPTKHIKYPQTALWQRKVGVGWRGHGSNEWDRDYLHLNGSQENVKMDSHPLETTAGYGCLKVSADHTGCCDGGWAKEFKGTRKSGSYALNQQGSALRGWMWGRDGCAWLWCTAHASLVLTKEPRLALSLWRSSCLDLRARW